MWMLGSVGSKAVLEARQCRILGSIDYQQEQRFAIFGFRSRETASLQQLLVTATWDRSLTSYYGPSSKRRSSRHLDLFWMRSSLSAKAEPNLGNLK